MKTILVSLISDQTIPNFLFIKTFEKIDKYLFISTDLMEDDERGNKRKFIIKAAEIPIDKQLNPIVVDAEKKENVLSKLAEFNWEEFDEIIVNVTGGTKMMSIAAYEFFKSKTKKIWYLPINKSQYHLCDNSDVKLDVKYQTSVTEYLNCCGIYSDENRYSEKKPLFTKEEINSYFKKFNTNEIDLEKIEKLRLLFRDDKAEFKKVMEKKGKIDLNSKPEFEWIAPFLESIAYKYENNYLKKEDVDFLTGGWFEEFCYYMFTDIGVSSIKLGLVLNPNPKQMEKATYFTKNDLDVVFVYNNMLYVVECKSGGMEVGDLFNKTVYLASALRKYFGLTVNSILCTLSNMNDDKKEKAATLGIKSIDRSMFLTDCYLDIVSSTLKIKK